MKMGKLLVIMDHHYSGLITEQMVQWLCKTEKKYGVYFSFQHFPHECHEGEKCVLKLENTAPWFNKKNFDAVTYDCIKGALEGYMLFETEAEMYYVIQNTHFDLEVNNSDDDDDDERNENDSDTPVFVVGIYPDGYVTEDNSYYEQEIKAGGGDFQNYIQEMKADHKKYMETK